MENVKSHSRIALNADKQVGIVIVDLNISNWDALASQHIGSEASILADFFNGMQDTSLGSGTRGSVAIFLILIQSAGSVVRSVDTRASTASIDRACNFIVTVNRSVDTVSSLDIAGIQSAQVAIRTVLSGMVASTGNIAEIQSAGVIVRTINPIIDA
jgi:hypothetical protein